MKQFFKIFFASMFGFITGIFLLLLVLFIIISAMLKSMDKEVVVDLKSNSVLVLDLRTEIPDRDTENPLDNLNFQTFQMEEKPGFYTILKNIEKAASDPEIKGIFIQAGPVPSGLATLDELREALIKFKKSKKFIIAYGNIYTQKAYYLSSVADKIYLHPEGTLELKGLSYESLFFKGLLSKLELEPQIIRHGKFKSAVEPLILDKMSPENRLQTHRFISTIWQHLSGKIAQDRNIQPEQLKNICDSLLVRSPEDAVKYGLADGLWYKDEVITELKKRCGVSASEKLPVVSMQKYRNRKSAETTNVRDGKIAVIYASGNIMEGESADGSIGGEDFSKTIRDARENNKIKAIVLRINSPGGSALASDEIWRELVLANKVKPVVVSMGDVAASGGYYIAAPARKIFASRVTVTGSIGVFGMILNTGPALEHKLGITTDTVKTNRLADFGTVTRALTAEEKAIYQQGVEKVYSSFISKVGEGRKLKTEEVDSIGQGRVWSGTDAKSIKLVDEFGGLQNAIDYAAKEAGLKKFRITELPVQQDPWSNIWQKGSDELETKWLKEKLGKEYHYLRASGNLLRQQGILALMPYSFDWY